MKQPLGSQLDALNTACDPCDELFLCNPCSQVVLVLLKSKAPIIGAPVLKKIGALRAGIGRAAWENHGRVQVPSPLGELTDWDHVRGSSPTLDERYNLIGHGFACFTRDVNFARVTCSLDG